jgi:hypothetical protein
MDWDLLKWASESIGGLGENGRIGRDNELIGLLISHSLFSLSIYGD